jgi:hypothetical protein
MEKPMIDSLKQLLKKDLEILGAATLEPWKDVTIGILTGEKARAIGPLTDLIKAAGDRDFIAHSRNNFESRIKALEIAVTLLNQMHNATHGMASHDPKQCNACCAVSEIARCLGVENAGV